MKHACFHRVLLLAGWLWELLKFLRQVRWKWCSGSRQNIPSADTKVEQKSNCCIVLFSAGRDVVIGLGPCMLLMTEVECLVLALASLVNIPRCETRYLLVFVFV